MFKKKKKKKDSSISLVYLFACEMHQKNNVRK